MGLWLGPQKGHSLPGSFARATATGRVRCEGDWEGKGWAGRACSPPHPHLHIQVSSGIQQHLHHCLVPTDAGVHQGGHALRWLKTRDGDVYKVAVISRQTHGTSYWTQTLAGQKSQCVEPCHAQGHNFPHSGNYNGGGKGGDITFQHGLWLKLEGFHGTTDLCVLLQQTAGWNEVGMELTGIFWIL